LDIFALFFVMSPMVGSAGETNEIQMRRLREKSEKRNEQRFRKMVAQLKMRLDY